MDLAKSRAVFEEHYHKNPWLVLDNPGLHLWEFLRDLYDNAGMPNSILSKLRICKSFAWTTGEITLEKSSGEIKQPPNLIELLKILRQEQDSVPTIICANQSLRANLMQQLLYLRLPVEEYSFALAGEKPGLQALEILAACMKSLELLTENVSDSEWQQELNTLIWELIGELCSDGFQLALVASKKSGKSTLLNCLLGQHLSPTGSELATPGSISYRESDKYRLIAGNRIVTFHSGKDLRYLLERDFSRAQYDVANNYCLENMEVEYIRENMLLPYWTLIDTPGHDYAGTGHAGSALKSLRECNAALFLIDYQKYLVESEKNLLLQAKKTLAQDDLFLALNKLDMSLQDSGAKSWIAAVDFIRTRLISIDGRFTEHIIRPLSARLYSNLLVLRNSVPDFPAIGELFEAKDDILDLLPALRRKLKGVLPEEIKSALANLAADAGRIADGYGFEKLTCDLLERISGVPALANHIYRSRIDMKRELSQAGKDRMKYLISVYSSRGTLSSVREAIAPLVNELNKI